MSWFVKEFYRVGIIRFGKFKLSSGIESPYYIDLRRLYSFPDLAFKVINELIKIINVKYDAVAGVATGGIPLAAYIAFTKRIPLGYVRVERKSHGMESKVEGVLEGRKVLIVDDVATTGQSLLTSAKALKALNASVVAAAAVVDREQGARGVLASEGIKLYTLITVTEIFNVLLKEGLIDNATYREVMEYTLRFKVRRL
ncbi:MAG: orotate phosphoribosyltransferase [Desulfurococcales archaeon ex4484_42]|nr:MAG: orotate phosphoribosyltransferase [Desulfurococcales archaeon ex4484_42]